MQAVQKELEELWKTSSSTTSQTLHKAAVKAGLDVTIDRVRSFVENQTEKELKKLDKIWKDNAYPAAAALYKLAQRAGLRLTAAQVSEWTKKQPSLQI